MILLVTETLVVVITIQIVVAIKKSQQHFWLAEAMITNVSLRQQSHFLRDSFCQSI